MAEYIRTVDRHRVSYYSKLGACRKVMVTWNCNSIQDAKDKVRSLVYPDRIRISNVTVTQTPVV